MQRTSVCTAWSKVDVKALSQMMKWGYETNNIVKYLTKDGFCAGRTAAAIAAKMTEIRKVSSKNTTGLSYDQIQFIKLAMNLKDLTSLKNYEPKKFEETQITSEDDKLMEVIDKSIQDGSINGDNKKPEVLIEEPSQDEILACEEINQLFEKPNAPTPSIDFNNLKRLAKKMRNVGASSLEIHSGEFAVKINL